MGRMWVFISVAVRMVHSVQNGITSGAKVRRTLAYECENIKEFFPEPVHDEHFVGCISMQKECLAKQREVPVSNKESNYNHYV